MSVWIMVKYARLYLHQIVCKLDPICFYCRWNTFNVERMIVGEEFMLEVVLDHPPNTLVHVYFA
jgi:hypothetical protein